MLWTNTKKQTFNTPPFPSFFFKQHFYLKNRSIFVLVFCLVAPKTSISTCQVWRVNTASSMRLVVRCRVPQGSGWEFITLAATQKKCPKTIVFLMKWKEFHVSKVKEHQWKPIFLFQAIYRGPWKKTPCFFLTIVLERCDRLFGCGRVFFSTKAT